MIPSQPRFLTSLLPAEERDDLIKLSHSCSGLTDKVEELRHAIDLHLWSNQQFHSLDAERGPDGGPTIAARERWRQHGPRFSAWSDMGARCGAMAIYGFHIIMKRTTTIANRCPTVLLHQDKSARRNATSLFNKYFPDFAGIRTFAAHPGETSEQDIEKHSITKALEIDGVLSVKEGASIFLEGTMMNGHYTVSYHGRTAAYRVHPETAAALEEVATEYFQSFAPVMAYQNGLAHERYSGSVSNE